MADQSFTFTMHTLNKYGVPCTDVTEYKEASSGNYSLQKTQYEYLILTKMKFLGEVLPPFEPITGIPGFNFCVFHNEPDANWGSKGYCSYYSTGSGQLISTVELPYMISAEVARSVDIDSDVVVMSAVEYEDQPAYYHRFTRNSKGELTLVGKLSLVRNLPINPITLLGTSNGQSGYDGNTLFYQGFTIRASNHLYGYIYSNSLGEDRQTGRLYKELQPDMADDSPTKRVLDSYIDLFVGDLAPGNGFTRQVTFGSTLQPEDLSYEYRDLFTFLINIFDDQYNDGSGKYTIGSGQIQGYHYSGQLFILLSFDDVRMGSGSQMYHKWYNSGGHFLYNWEWPTYLNEGVDKFYSLTGRLSHGDSFFYIAANVDTKQSYLMHYSLWTGSLTQTELTNPYKESEGYYQLKNFQLLEDKYIMVHTTNNHCIFFNAYLPSLGIQGEVTLENNYETVGYCVVPQIGDDQPVSPVTNKLLELCNNIRTLKMTWALNQYQVCKDHADWCTAHAVFQHEGPIAGQDAATSLRTRNNVAGISAGVSENITLVLETNSENEQIQAYENFIESPHHLEGIIRGGNRYMSWACSTYNATITEIAVGVGMWDGSGYTTEPSVRPILESERGRLKIYVQNFIWY